MAVTESILSGATTLLRASFVAVLVSIILITAAYLPPFPPQFGGYLTKIFGYALQLEPWFPVRLAFSLYLVQLAVDVAVSTWLWVTWFKDWLLGRPGAGTLV